MKKRKIADQQALEQLEIDVEASQMADAKAVISKISTGMWDRNELVLWIDERQAFNDLFYPAENTDLTAAQRLWDRVLGTFIQDKAKLVFLAQEIVTSFGGIGKVLNVDYDQHTQTLLWKVQFSVELSL